MAELEKLNIDGEDHYMEDMTEEQKSIVVSIYKCDEEMDRCKHLIAICQTARQAYINDLGAQLKSEKS
jgi:hypothetical protein